jgi:hypothetical protein
MGKRFQRSNSAAQEQLRECKTVTIRHVVLLRGVSNLHWQINPRISASCE